MLNFGVSALEDEEDEAICEIVLFVSSGVRWILSLILLYAVLTDSAVSGRLVDGSAIVDGVLYNEKSQNDSGRV